MKKLYVSAWFLLAAAGLMAALTGILSPGVLFVFSLIGLGLIYGFALWSVIVNTREIKTE